MTGILACTVAVGLLVGALYLVACHGPLVAAWWYRIFNNPDPYPPEAAEAPHDPEPHCRLHPGPRVVAGSDLDRLLAIRRAEMNAAFDALIAADLADLDAHLTDFYVLPEGDR